MEYVRFAVKFAALALICTLVGGYIFLVYSGDLPKPDVDAFLRQVAPPLASGGSAIVAVAILLCFFLTAIAPLIYAARSGDFFTVIVSLVALVVCFAMLVYSRTVIDMVLAAIVYFTSAFISVIMYSTNRISEAISKADSDELLQRPIAERQFR
ncbi:hypothetical protein [Bradyrhizobium sp. USDA 10063]